MKNSINGNLTRDNNAVKQYIVGGQSREEMSFLC